jgi:hypothetical protein
MTKLTKEERKQYWKLYYKKRYGGKEGRARKAAEMRAYRLKCKSITSK